MQTRILGRTDLELSAIGLGTWAMGGPASPAAWGEQDDGASVRTIHAAADAGINWIDTAAIYGLGHAEEVIGRALKEMQTPMMVASKCGRVLKPDGNIGGELSRAAIRAECEQSLARLGVEVIDLYQIHWPHPDEKIEEAWAAVAELVREGKVRHAGASNFDIGQMKRCQAVHPLSSVQLPYSLLRRDIEDRLLPYCREQGIGVLAYSPLQKGLLTGKVSPEWVARLSETDHRRRDEMFRAAGLEKNLNLVCELQRCSHAFGLTLDQMAIAWVLHQSGVAAAIVGGRQPVQILQSASAARVALDPDQVERIGATRGPNRRRERVCAVVRAVGMAILGYIVAYYIMIRPVKHLIGRFLNRGGV